MALTSFTITLDETKVYLKVEHDLENDLITDLTQAAIEEVGSYLNRDWLQGEYPAAVKMAVLEAVAFWYENRGDSDLPDIAKDRLEKLRFLPGL